MTWDFTKPMTGGPTDRGFDSYFGVDLPNLPPFTFIRNNRVVTQPSEPFEPDPDEGDFLPNNFRGAPAAPGWRMQEILPRITEHAVKHIHDRAKHDQPFFLYFPMTSPHTPVVPTKSFRGKSGIASMADFVMETDWSAGQLIQAVDKAGIAENTIVIFTADNGHAPQGWDDLVEAGHRPSGPYRGRKGDIWEGGHRIPLVIRWPNQIAAGTQSNQLVCLTDLFATCADVVDQPLPINGAEDSISFLPSALGKPNPRCRTGLVNHSNMGEFAFRDGPWKLVYRMSGKNLEHSRDKPTIAELYHLDADIAEQTDVRSQHPDRVARMTEALRRLIQRGASREGLQRSNDAAVQFDSIQRQRWAAAISADSDR